MPNYVHSMPVYIQNLSMAKALGSMCLLNKTYDEESQNDYKFR